MYKEKLMALGIDPCLRGFEYLNYAIQCYKPLKRKMILYKEVADHFGVSPHQAERSMRFAVSKTSEKMELGNFIAKYKILWEEKEK